MFRGAKGRRNGSQAPETPGGQPVTTMFPLFFGVPQAAIRLGRLKEISGVALKIYIGLLYDSERYQTRELMRTVSELRELVGGAPNSHVKARDELAAVGLVEFEERGTEGILFRLCDPETGKPWPGDPKEKITYQKKTARQAGTPIVNQPDSSSSRLHSAALGRTDRSAMATSRPAERLTEQRRNNRRRVSSATVDSPEVLSEIDASETDSEHLASERIGGIPRGLESPYPASPLSWDDVGRAR